MRTGDLLEGEEYPDIQRQWRWWIRAYHHLLLDPQRMCTWRDLEDWPWRQREKKAEQKAEQRRKESLRQFVQPEQLTENGGLRTVDLRTQKTNSRAIDSLLCSCGVKWNSRFSNYKKFWGKWWWFSLPSLSNRSPLLGARSTSGGSGWWVQAPFLSLPLSAKVPEI